MSNSPSNWKPRSGCSGPRRGRSCRICKRRLPKKPPIDLKPFASNAQKKIAAAISDFQTNEEGVRVTTDITSLRLADIAFDSRTLRVIAVAEGAINVYVTSLPGL